MLPTIPVLDIKIPDISIVIKQEEPKPREPTLYTIKSGDTLTSISKLYSVDLKRLWAANTTLTDPDKITPDTTLKIPESDEVLPERAMPVTIEVRSGTQQSPPSGGFSSSGNTYQPGQCVWYVKNLRPEIPNSWGSAVSWLYNAQADGWPTGSEPRVGAVGWTYGHVVLITAVNGDGTVSYTDMNGRWIPYEIGYGTKEASYYEYIY